MANLADILETKRAHAARIANDPNAPERQWARPGEWLDVLDMLEELQRETARMTEKRQRVVMLAFLTGQAFELARLRAAMSPTVDVADRVQHGGERGAARAHGPRPQREAKRERWRKRFAELRGKFPEAPKKTLLGMIADETGETVRTLRRYIKQR